MLLLRRIALSFLCLLFVAESAGVARAFGRAAQVTCCCGAHSAARKCKCSHCPVIKRRARAHRDAAPDRLAAGRECQGATDHDAPLSFAALPVARVPGDPIILTAPHVPPAPAMLLDRTLEPRRPPP